MYDFRSLSDVDFEFLTRDLLQKELGITLESFTAGRDDGVDLRYSCLIKDRDKLLVVQCKHFARSTYSNLKSKIKTQELKKLKKLAPSRYIFVTSLGLTPANKKELFVLLTPYCRNEADILGREDLNNLLTKFPEIEQTHFKLWLTGSAVLNKILHSAIFNQTEFDLGAIKSKLKLYVQNESYREALEILENEHYCIVAGIPGIGKTTLAEVLLVHYLNLGFEAFSISSDINEAYLVFQGSRQQVFFYDDFLGQTSLEEKLHKNEEQKLVRFIETVRATKDSRFILTTREYILNQAKLTYEKLDRSQIEVNKCVISLDKYSHYNKARILYNHLYFSNLPEEYKQALVENQNYLTIIEHENYSPRVIQWMTEKGQNLEIKTADYFTHFIDNLDNPTGLWEHAFDFQLSEPTQYLIYVLGTLPTEILIEDLEAAFNSYYEFSARRRNFRVGKNDFRNALKEAESNFIFLEKKSENTTVRFHNPSIRDFTENRLANEPQSLLELCVQAIFYEQLTKLWNLSVRKSEVNKYPLGSGKLLFEVKRHEFLKQLNQAFTTQSCNLQTFIGSNERKYVHRKPSLENRLIFAVQTSAIIFTGSYDEITNFLAPLFSILCERLKKGKGQKEDLLALLSFVQKSPPVTPLLNQEFLVAAKDFLLLSLNSVEDFQYFLDFKQNYPKLIEPDEWESVKAVFTEFAEEEIKYFLSDDKPDSDTAEWWIDELNKLNREFKTEINDEIQKLKEFIENESQKEEEAENDELNEPVEKAEIYTNEDIKSMFDSLLFN